MLGYWNRTESRQDNVQLEVSLPEKLGLIPKTTSVKNGSNPDGKLVSDGIAEQGINISDYAPGAAAYLKFQVKVGPDVPCGRHDLSVQYRLWAETEEEDTVQSLPIATYRPC